MSTDLSLLKQDGTTSDAAAIQGIITQTEYLPYISIMGPNSDYVKKNKVAQGHFILQLSKDDFVDLGTELDLVVIDARTKAVDLRGDKPISFFKADSENFTKLMAADAAVTKGMSNILWGIEFLVLITGLTVASIPGPVYATFFFNNKTLRNSRVSKPMMALVGGVAYLKTKLIETEDYSWWGIEKPVASVKPIETMPPIEELIAQKNKFKATTIEPEIEAAAAPVSDRAR